MIRLFLSLIFLVIGCSNPIMSDVSEEDCECVFDITSTLPSIDGIYQLEFNNNLVDLAATTAGKKKDIE